MTFTDSADGFTTPNFSINTNASNGVAAIDAAGNWTYTPNANFNGADSFIVQVTDDDGNVETQTINITVTAVNDIPVGIPSIIGTVTEDQTLSADTSAISDADGLGAFSYQWQRSTDGGLTWTNVGSNSVNYTLGDNDVGADIRVQVSYTDGEGTNENVISGAVGPVVNVNDEEVLVNNEAFTILTSSTNNVITTDMLMTVDVDNIDSELTYTITTAPENGTLYLGNVAMGVNATFTQADIVAGMISYQHDGSTSTSDSMAFTVDDGMGTSTSGVFFWTVTTNGTTTDPIIEIIIDEKDPETEVESSDPSVTIKVDNGNKTPIDTKITDEVTYDNKNLVFSGPIVSFGDGRFNIGELSRIQTDSDRDNRSEQQTSYSNLSMVLKLFYGDELEQPTYDLRVSIPMELGQALDELGQQQSGIGELDIRTAGVIVGSVSLSAGFVSWMLRAGSLMASLISTKPAWSEFDPLPIFDQKDNDLFKQ